MNTKVKRGKGKAIIGIALAAVMLASVFAPAVSAEVLPDESYSGLYNNITLTVDPEVAASVLIGQKLNFVGGIGSEKIQGDPASDTVAGELFTADSTGKFDTSSMTETGIYYVNPSTSGTTVVHWDAKLAVSRPTMTLDIKAGGISVSSITEGTELEIDFANNLNGSDMVSLVITDPDGNTIKATPSQNFSKINVSYLMSQYGVGAGVDTSDWSLGTYTFKVATKVNASAGLGAQGLDMSSNEETIRMLKSAIDIKAEKTTAPELEVIKLTVTGVKGSNISIATSDAAHTIFPGGSNDNPIAETTGFNHTIDADGTRIYTVYFDETGSYTITVTDYDADTDDTVDITVTEMAVTFDLPITVVIGEKFIMKGTANTGDSVDIFVDGLLYTKLNNLVLDEDGTFSEEMTADGDIGMSVPGSIRLKAWIDCTETGSGTGRAYAPPIPPVDGDTAVLLVEPGLTAEIALETVAQEDSFYVKGTSKGARSVDVLTVSPKGASGKGMDPLTAYKGLTYKKPSVSSIDDTFSQKIIVDENANTGSYLVAVLYKGRDGYYGTTGNETKTLIQALEGYGDLTGKTQEQVLAMLVHLTTKAGSDDLIWVGKIKVEAAKVTFDTIADVAIGEPLAVAGTTNREEGHAILITVKGPVELTPEIALVENGTFSATFDTTDAEVGIYTVTADDGDGHTDDATVEIVKEIVPVATPTPEPTAKPTATPAPTAVATATPTPTPTEEPGFEAVFAIAGLLSIAYLVLRRRK